MSEQPQPPSEAAFFTSIREWGLVRGAHGVVGGVIDGVGQRIGLARVPARLLTVVAWLLLPGVVMLAYAAGWALLPDTKGNIIIQNFGRGVTNVGALIGIAVLTFLGIVAFDSGPLFNLLGMGGGFLGDGFLPRAAVISVPAFLFLAFVTGLVVFIVWLAKRSNRTTADAPLTPPPSGTSAPGGTSATPGSPVTPGSTAAPSHAPQAPGTPQPWEPALLPGDPRAGVPASSGTVKPATNAAHTAAAAHTATAHTTTGPTGATGPATGPAPAPPRPPAAPARPPAPTVPGPGQGAYLAFAAVLLIAAAVATGLARADMLAVSPLLAWGAAITVGLGAILVIVALAGRKLGFLGLLSVFAVLIAVLFSANAGDIRTSYNESRDWWDSASSPVVSEEVYDFEEAPEDRTFNLMPELSTTYSSVLIDGTCLSPSDEAPWDEVHHYGESMASMRLDTVDDDMVIDLTARYTRLAIPAGTGLEIQGSGHTTVVWEDRDAACAFWFDDYYYDYDEDFYEEYDDDGNIVESTPRLLLSVSNPDVPVITVKADADQSIYIEEVAK